MCQFLYFLLCVVVSSLINETGISGETSCPVPVHLYTLRENQSCLFGAHLFFQHIQVEFYSFLAGVLVACLPEFRLRVFTTRALLDTAFRLQAEVFRHEQLRLTADVPARFFVLNKTHLMLKALSTDWYWCCHTQSDSSVTKGCPVVVLGKVTNECRVAATS